MDLLREIWKDLCGITIWLARQIAVCRTALGRAGRAVRDWEAGVRELGLVAVPAISEGPDTRSRTARIADAAQEDDHMRRQTRWEYLVRLNGETVTNVKAAPRVLRSGSGCDDMAEEGNRCRVPTSQQHREQEAEPLREHPAAAHQVEQWREREAARREEERKATGERLWMEQHFPQDIHRRRDVLDGAATRFQRTQGRVHTHWPGGFGRRSGVL